MLHKLPKKRLGMLKRNFLLHLTDWTLKCFPPGYQCPSTTQFVAILAPATTVMEFTEPCTHWVAQTVPPSFIAVLNAMLYGSAKESGSVIVLGVFAASVLNLPPWLVTYGAPIKVFVVRDR